MPSDRPERAPGSPTHAPVVLAALLLTCAAAAEPAPSIVPEPAVSSDSARAEIERLRALGYLEFAEDESADELSRKGVTRRDPQRTQPGYNLYNEQHTAAAVLMDAAGRVVHRFEDPAGKYWARVELLPDGDLIAVGDVVWEFREPIGADGKPRSRIVRARRLPEAERAAGELFSASD